MRTSDAGNNWWKYDNSPTSKALKAIGSPDLNEIWIVGDNGTIVQSANRGQLWSEFTNPPYDSFRDVSFDVKLVNSKLDYRGWIVGEGGVILKMEEDGSGWREHPTPTNRNLYSIGCGERRHDTPI